MREFLCSLAPYLVAYGPFVFWTTLLSLVLWLAWYTAHTSVETSTESIIGEQVLTALYASEINWKMSTFWDGGYDWELGDELNGVIASGSQYCFDDAIEDLRQAAIKHFPQSDFARQMEEQL